MRTKPNTKRAEPLYMCFVFAPDTYKCARGKLAQAEKTSCLETDNEEEKATSRKRRKKTFSDASDEASESDVEEPVRKKSKKSTCPSSLLPLPEPPIMLQGLHSLNQGMIKYLLLPISASLQFLIACFTFVEWFWVKIWCLLVTFFTFWPIKR